MYVAHGPIVRLYALAVLATVASTNAACATVSCPAPAADPSDPRVLVKVVHIEGSDAPTAWSLVAYSDGMLELEKFGKKRLCRQIREQELRELTGLVGREEFQAVAEFDGFLGHQEWMQVIHSGTVRGYVAEDLPPEVLAVFEELDLLFTNEFGRRYRWPLIGGASGPGRSAARQLAR